MFYLFLLLFSTQSFSSFVNSSQCASRGADLYSSKDNCELSTGGQCEEFKGGACEHYILSNGELVKSEDKKSAYEQKLKSDEAKKEIDILNKESLRISINEDIKTATTFVKLKAVLEKMIEVQNAE